MQPQQDPLSQPNPPAPVARQPDVGVLNASAEPNQPQAPSKPIASSSIRSRLRLPSARILVWIGLLLVASVLLVLLLTRDNPRDSLADAGLEVADLISKDDCATINQVWFVSDQGDELDCSFRQPSIGIDTEYALNDSYLFTDDNIQYGGVKLIYEDGGGFSRNMILFFEDTKDGWKLVDVQTGTGIIF